MQYPIRFSFKKIALTNKVTATDAMGTMQYFAQQKMFKLKEKIQIYSDESKTQQIAEINADRVIDFSPTFSVTNPAGQLLVQVSRQGGKSLWKASYQVLDNQNQAIYSVKEDNPWVKVLDTLLTEIPFLGLISGYFFNPSYSVSDSQGNIVAKIEKEKSFFEANYQLSLVQPAPQQVDPLLPVSMLVVILRERFRG